MDNALQTKSNYNLVAGINQKSLSVENFNDAYYRIYCENYGACVMKCELYGRLDIIEYKKLKKKYLEENSKFKESMIFHVGTGAGLYSELGAMLECMCYCYVHQIQFRVYSDDVNFSNENGWNELFEPIGCENHNGLNRYANYRYKNYHRLNGVAVPNLLFKRIIVPNMLKMEERVHFLTQDLFSSIVSADFRFSKIKWSLFNIDGNVRDEYSKLASLALRYNDKTAKAILDLRETLNLPAEYASIQIRGGDKTQEFTQIMDVKKSVEFLEKHVQFTKNIFVFTDDFRNVAYIRHVHPEWNVYTLTRPDECGYFNASFNALPWEKRRQDLIKLFAIVEICIQSSYHVGCNGTCVNNYIRSCRMGKPYDEYTIGKLRTKKGIDKIKRIFGI